MRLVKRRAFASLDQEHEQCQTLNTTTATPPTNRAIALRFYCRYVDMRNSAEHYGADLTSTHSRLPTSRDATEQYLAAIDEWLWEIPESATAALAVTEFAGVVTADRFLGEVLRDQIIAEERDAFYRRSPFPPSLTGSTSSR